MGKIKNAEKSMIHRTFIDSPRSSGLINLAVKPPNTVHAIEDSLLAARLMRLMSSSAQPARQRYRV